MKRSVVVVLIGLGCVVMAAATYVQSGNNAPQKAAAVAQPSPEVQQRVAALTEKQELAHAAANVEQILKSRDAYAELVERNLLAKGLDAHVRATGKQHDTLRVSWVAMSRPVVYNMINSDGMRTDAPALGFRKVIFTDDGSFSQTRTETWTMYWNGGAWSGEETKSGTRR